MADEPLVPSASGDAGSSARLGRRLYAVGALTFPLGLGLWLGYWIADAGVRWAPGAIGIVLAVWTLGLVLLLAGTYALGPLSGNARGRKRSVVLAGLIVVVAGVYVGTQALSQATPLTSLSPATFDRNLRADASLYRDYDRALAGVIALLDDQPGVFDGAGEPPVLTADQEAAIAAAWTTYVHVGARLDQLRRHYEDYHHFDLSRLERDRHLRAYLLTFAAELALYGRTAELIRRVERNPNVAKFLDVPRPAHGVPADAYTYVREELAGLSDLSRVVAGQNYLAWLNTAHGARADAEAMGYGWLWREVEVHLARIHMHRGDELAKLTIAADVAPLRKSLKAWTFPVQKEVAEWMGDTRVRRPAGRYLIGPEHTAPMEAVLEPGDVLLARKNWYLSNVGLPGFWPHGLLYLGGPTELAATFDADPEVLAWVERIAGEPMPFTAFLATRHPRAWADLQASADDAQPLVVIEAISEGVVLNTWAHAAGDYLVALRPKLPRWVRAQALHRALSYLGRPYDFDFDFATDHALVCTELVWRSYRPVDGAPGLRMEPIKVAGRRALPANEIARLFQREHGRDDAQLEFVYFLDAREASQSVRVADEAAFLETPDRPQWDFAQR